jgi:hypothetical protein
MLIENVEVFGWKSALRGMRNPMNSWDKGDSVFYSGQPLIRQGDYEVFTPESPNVGPKDLRLASSLVRAGDEHGKFARQIVVWADWTLPLLLWSEVDTYKQFVVRDSCSTMHRLGRQDITEEDFEDRETGPGVLADLNALAAEFRTTGSDETLYRLKKRLPCGFLQKATMLLNYQVLRNMYLQRRFHRLSLWNIKNSGARLSLCKWIGSLPYAAELITVDDSND